MALTERIVSVLRRLFIRKNTKHCTAGAAHTGPQCSVIHQGALDLIDALSASAQHIFKYIIHTADDPAGISLLQCLNDPVGIWTALVFASVGLLKQFGSGPDDPRNRAVGS